MVFLFHASLILFNIFNVADDVLTEPLKLFSKTGGVLNKSRVQVAKISMYINFLHLFLTELAVFHTNLFACFVTHLTTSTDHTLV